MQPLLFQELERKIEQLLEKHDALKKLYAEKEQLLSAKDKEHAAEKRRLEALLRERETIKQRIDALVAKLDSSGLL